MVARIDEDIIVYAKCDSFSIPIGEPEWKKVCTSCYIDNKDIRRQCSSCL
jgi:hypothetical protein